jgi:hypothetical protein
MIEPLASFTKGKSFSCPYMGFNAAFKAVFENGNTKQISPHILKQKPYTFKTTVIKFCPENYFLYAKEAHCPVIEDIWLHLKKHWHSVWLKMEQELQSSGAIDKVTTVDFGAGREDDFTKDLKRRIYERSLAETVKDLYLAHLVDENPEFFAKNPEYDEIEGIWKYNTYIFNYAQMWIVMDKYSKEARTNTRQHPSEYQSQFIKYDLNPEYTDYFKLNCSAEYGNNICDDISIATDKCELNLFSAQSWVQPSLS